MNVEEFDIEKLIKEDAESIEIDRDFKAQLKANLMNQSKSSNKVIDFDSVKKHDNNKQKKKPEFKKYLAIASSFAIVGMFGLNFAFGGMVSAIAKANKNVENDLNVKSYVLGQGDKPESGVNAKGDDQVVVLEPEKEKEDKVVETKPEKDDKDTQAQPSEPVKEEGTTTSVNEEKKDSTPKNDNVSTGQEVAEEDKKDIAKEGVDETEVKGKNETIFGNNGTVVDSEVNKNLIEEDGKTHAGPNTQGGEKIDINSREYLQNRLNDKNIEYYSGMLKLESYEDIKIQDNKVLSIDGEGQEKVVFEAEKGNIRGIRKNKNELIVVSSESEDCVICNISLVDMKTGENSTIITNAVNAIFDKEFKYVAYEMNGNIFLVNIDSKETVTKQGKNAAWSPDGEYISYIKNVKEENNSLEYPVLVVFDIMKNKENYLDGQEYIQNGEEITNRYNYGKNIWSKNEKKIYVVREDKKIISDNPEENIDIQKWVIEK